MAREAFPDVFDFVEIGMSLAGVRDHRILRVNAALCRLLGRDEASLIGRRWETVVEPSDLAFQLEKARVIETGGQEHTRHLVRLVRADGEIVHLLASGSLLTGPDGESRILSQVQDVTGEVAGLSHLRLVLENTPISLFLVDREGRVLYSGGGVVPEIVEGLRAAQTSTIFDVFGDLEVPMAAVRRALSGERVSQVVTAFGRAFDLRTVPIMARTGVVSSVAAVATDVTERENAVAELRVRSTEQAALARLAQQALDSLDQRRMWDDAADALADRLAADLVTICELDSGTDQARLVASAGRASGPEHPDEPTADGPGAGGANLVVPVGRLDDPRAFIHIHRAAPATAPATATVDEAAAAGEGEFPVQEQEFARAVAAVLGSAAMRFQMERETLHHSLHDGLTGLPNRRALLQHLRQALEQADRDERVGVLFIDLDGFKAVNDSYGHRTGDRLLRAVAQRLRCAVRRTDVVARLSGDEFAVVCEHLGHQQDALGVADQVLMSLAAPFAMDCGPLAVNASIGTSLAGSRGADAEELLDEADIAMYAAKRSGPGRCVVFRESMRGDTARHLKLGTNLRTALDGDELMVLYQPVRTTVGDIVGASATTCWRDPAGGPLAGAAVTPLAEDFGLAPALDGRALRTACRAAADWEWRQPGEPPRLVVVISGRTLADPTFVDGLAGLLDETGAARACRLCLDLADSAPPDDPVPFADSLDLLRRLDVTVQVGAYGHGGCTPPRMNRPPIDGLRISGQLVGGVCADPRDGALVGAHIDFAHSLGLIATADGVETRAQHAALTDLGCDLIQGPFAGPAEPVLPVHRWAGFPSMSVTDGHE
ncbi:diguanylate cyclase domain-containing protein [Frankia sp. QA3]|uniref:sensor domain-containing protein n=1 Tax=Frankia sp. QA3 TaxID=710111 RepID=UPI000269C9B6|nr:diguanylate cyclase [Frankia sp. QA3]EIV94679.1 PAS domain S-box/diguanylate cyclase (GGDEF) domain-containing protein [Frankia sp. QA3]